MTHRIAPELLGRTVHVLVVGCGGNGSVVATGLPYLHQAMLLAGHPGGLRVTLMDGDVVSPTNCVRQPFGQADIGLPKVTVLISRINLFWGFAWEAVPEHLTAKTEIRDFDIVIGCVDTRAARLTINGSVCGWRSRTTYYLDVGNIAEGGQFVLGQPLNSRNRRSATRLRTVAELMPEILDPDLDDDSMPSCSALEALERHGLFVNPILAMHALALLTRLFRYGGLDHHGAFVNVAQNRAQPLAIDPALWRKMRKRGHKFATGQRLTAG